MQNQQRQKYTIKTRIENPTDKEWTSFDVIQHALSTTCMLIHFDNKKVLFINVDSNKTEGFETMIYHVVNKIPDPKDYPDKKKQIRPILFLSRVLKKRRNHVTDQLN